MARGNRRNLALGLLRPRRRRGADATPSACGCSHRATTRPAIRAIEAAFEEANEGKDVEIVVYPEEEYVTKVNTALVAGNPPDVAIIESDDWMKAGYVVELTDQLAEWGVSVEDFNPGGMSRGALENDPANGIYGIGTFLGGNVLVYNKAIFDAAGVPHPSTGRVDDLREYADMCRAAGPAERRPRTQTSTAAPCRPTSRSASIPIYGEDGRTAEGNMNAPELAEAFEIGAALINEGLAPSSSILETISRPISSPRARSRSPGATSRPCRPTRRPRSTSA